MTHTQLIDTKKLLTIETPQYVIEDTRIRDLNGGIIKKFTSLSKSPVTYTHIYDPTIFRWKFGDETDSSLYTETDQRVIYHTYQKTGTYLVQHQACNFCTCSEWGICYKSISVQPPTGILPALATAGFFFLILPKKVCEDYDNKKDCNKHNDCQWLDEEKMCVKKCKEGYKLEKVKDGKKKPYKYICMPIMIPTKEEKAKLIPPKPKLKPFTKEEKYLIAKLKEKGAEGEPTCMGPECRIGKWLAVARPKGQPPIIIHDP